MTKKHSFHIPVMGVAFTIETPSKVAQFGIDSVIPLADDIILEKLRKCYCSRYKIPYEEISTKIEDFRAKRITSYLNLVKDLAEKKFDELKNSSLEAGSALKKYFNMLPNSSEIKKEFLKLTSENYDIKKLKSWISNNLSMGSIDVNIMTKLDKVNYKKGQQLDSIYNDAHAALRGFAKSDLDSSIVFSAGMNPRLYSYIEQFDEFYPDANGHLKKKVILKVSDYRSALIQGKFLAKKGIWVSEYRLESGLNCGGHAFATDGFLLGPILAEFRNNRQTLIDTVHEVFVHALESKNRPTLKDKLPIKITAQGGVGTAEEHTFLLDHYNLDSIGWGSPFLLVPEATTVDEKTLHQLRDAKESELYLSGVSPLGVPFNNLRDNSNDVHQKELVKLGKPGSKCPKRVLVSNTEFTKKAICTSSAQYQKLKIQQLDEENVSPSEYKLRFNKIVEKACLCVGLAIPAQINNGISTSPEGDVVSVCPGPNLAYFSKIFKLEEMVNHIYGRVNVITRKDRPNLFIKELNIYIDYLADKIDECKDIYDKKQEKYFSKFIKNMNEGINYYEDLFSTVKDTFESTKSIVLEDLISSKKALDILHLKLTKK